jgi:hypothetical protein
MEIQLYEGKAFARQASTQFPLYESGSGPMLYVCLQNWEMISS